MAINEWSSWSLGVSGQGLSYEVVNGRINILYGREYTMEYTGV